MELHTHTHTPSKSKSLNIYAAVVLYWYYYIIINMQVSLTCTRLALFKEEFSLSDKLFNIGGCLMTPYHIQKFRSVR
jgi:hypothetical protein